MSQFAAGCAICGVDLEARRRTAAPARSLRLRAPSLPRLDEEATTLIVIALLTLGIPMVGIAAAIYALSHNAPRPVIQRALWVVLGVGVLLLLSPQVRFGIWRLLGA